MNRSVKIFLIAVAIAIVTIATAIFFIWNSITAPYIKGLINKELSKLKGEKITVSVTNLSLEKKFPFLDIKAKTVFLNKNSLSLAIKGVSININIAKLAIAKLWHKNYFGNISVQKIVVNIKKTHTNTKSAFPKVLPEIPFIPLSLNLPSVAIKAGSLSISGKLKLKTNLILKTNKIDFEGLINNVETKIHLLLNNNKMQFRVTAPKIKYYSLLIRNFELEGRINRNLHLEILAHANSASIKGILINQPSLNLSCFIKGYSLVSFTSNLNSNNAFSAKIGGTVNIKNPLDSNLSGYISTPYINGANLFCFLPKKAKPYIKSAVFSLKKIKFSGKPSISFIKNGTVYIKNVRFRINTKDPFFLIKSGEVKINKEKIYMVAYGKFDKINAERSEFIIYRKKGFPSDIHLHLKGTVTELIRSFIEENILSKNDLKLLGRSKKLKGKIRATVDVYGYRFKPKPFFNFDVKLYPKGVEFVNPNIPNGWIKSSGFVEIKRIIKRGNVKELFVLFKDFRAQTKESTFYTKNFKLTIQPSIGFKGSFNTTISRGELSILEMDIAKKKDSLKFKEATFKGTLSGSLKDLKFSSHITIPIKISGISVNVILKGVFKPPVLNITNMTIRGVGNVNISAIINTKMEKIIYLHMQANSLSISDIRYLLPLKTHLSGIISGNFSLKFINNVPFIEKAKLTLKKGQFSVFDNISAFIKATNKQIEFYDASFYYDGNPIVASGYYDIVKKTINVKLFANRFYIDMDKLLKNKSLSSKKTIELKLPKQNITVKFDILNLYLRFKKKVKDLLATTLLLKNSSKTFLLNIESAVSRWKIEENKKSGLITIKAKDWAIWPFITNCNNHKNFMEISSSLHTTNPEILTPKSIEGNINFATFNGCITEAPSALNLISLLNPFLTFFNVFEKSKGLTYKKIKAKLTLKKGILKTKKDSAIIFDGETIDMFAYGNYNLIKGKIDAYVTFITFSTINKIVSHIPIVGWIIGGKNKSFTGLSFHVYGDVSRPKIKPVPFKNLAKGVLGIIKRTIMLPLSIFGVK